MQGWTGSLDPDHDGAVDEYGIPKRVLLEGLRVGDTDPLLPRAAAFLVYVWPIGRITDQILATKMDPSMLVEQATALMPQLFAFGFVGEPDANGERPVFDGHGVSGSALAQDGTPGMAA